MERLYLREELLIKSKAQTGEHSGGTYVARVVTGTEKDGSPQYRYFRKQSEYNEYLSRTRDAKKTGRSKTGGGKKKQGPTIKETLQTKLKEEQESSSKKTRSGTGSKISDARDKKQGLLSGRKDKKTNKLAASLRIYLGDTDE